jgi:hypothetical protein
VAASGALDEFSRKPARNDYPLMALWEMGVRHLRIPLADLRDPATRERMRALQRCGHTFTVYTHGVPSGASRDLLIAHADLLVEWELIAPLRGIDAVAVQAARLKALARLSASFSKLRRPGEERHHGLKARHVIEHGFYLSEQDELAALLARGGAGQVFDAFLFRLSRSSPASASISAIERLVSSFGKSGRVYARLAADNPAEACDDDLANANRVAESMLAAFSCANVALWLDTLDDVDRGYFPRTGLVDRRFNPRLAGNVVRNMHSVLGSDAAVPTELTEQPAAYCRMLTASAPTRAWTLLLPDRKSTLNSALPESADCIDLASGRIQPVCARGGQTLQLSSPMLLVYSSGRTGRTRWPMAHMT